jgi:hypothetical protein
MKDKMQRSCKPVKKDQQPVPIKERDEGRQIVQGELQEHQQFLQ